VLCGRNTGQIATTFVSRKPAAGARARLVTRSCRERVADEERDRVGPRRADDSSIRHGEQLAVQVVSRHDREVEPEYLEACAERPPTDRT
jgi:hypothetical protein